MPLIVPALRLLLLFLNVYESFKTLQLPQRSARTGERTVRALTQRKRDMKGCMAIWLVWCCFTVYERLFDGIVSLFVPFYSELKAIVYLFQILTRARGAEPLYLHVLRPLIKPYVTTLDWSLDSISTLGDFLLLIVALPYNLFMEWWKPHAREELRQEDTVEATRGIAPSRRVTRSTNSSSSDNTAPSNSATLRGRGNRQNSSTRTSYNGTAGPSRTVPATKQGNHARTRSAVPSRDAPMALYEVWHPPALREEGRRVVSDSAAKTRLDSDAMASVSTPTKKSYETAPSASEVEEWRMYPPFPSAYPATPYVPTKSVLGSSNSEPVDGLPRIGEDGMDVSLVTVEVEEWRKYEPFPSAYPPTPQVVARTVSGSKRNIRQSALEPVEEQNQDFEPAEELSRSYKEAEEEPAQRRETRSRSARPKPTTTQSLPSRTGRRTRPKDIPHENSLGKDPAGQDFYRRPSGRVGRSQLIRQHNDNNDQAMDVDLNEEDDEDADVSSDLDLDMTLRTPARPIIKSSWQQRRTESLDAENDMDDSMENPSPPTLTQNSASTASAAFLTVPSATARTNSNYTLSSNRNSWASSRSGSLTTLSRNSSLRTSAAVSKAPSTQSVAPSMSSRGSRSSGHSSALELSDSSSVVGVKRPLSVVTESKFTRATVKRATAKAALTRESSAGPGNPLRKTSSVKETRLRSARAAQKHLVEGEGGKLVDEASDTLESAEESNAKTSKTTNMTNPTKKRRRMGPAAAEFASRLAQVSEETSAPTRSNKRTRVHGSK